MNAYARFASTLGALALAATTTVLAAAGTYLFTRRDLTA